MRVKLIEIYFPYCIERIPSGKYVILNRDYKPLGMTIKGHVDYEPHAITLRMTPEKASQLSWEGKGDISRIYLYRTLHGLTTKPGWGAYCERLKVLAEMTSSSGTKKG